jgi:hypothetical protein
VAERRRKGVGTTVLIVIALLAAGGFGAYLAGRTGTDLPFPLPKLAGCVVTAANATDRESWALDIEQMANAATITAVGIRKKVPERGIVVALATALQESKLENLAGGDRDSVGLFQQRPSQGWGSAQEISDPRYAATKFYNALVKVKGWEKLRVTDAAQKVQRSAFPEAYQKWEDEASVLATALLGAAKGAVNCTVPDDEPIVTGDAAINHVVTALRADWATTVSTTAEPGLQGVRIAAGDATRGWQLAHWSVAQAADNGVTRVAFDGREWRAESGEWRESPAVASHVVVEVFA